jgi:hypothetical protein
VHSRHETAFSVGSFQAATPLDRRVDPAAVGVENGGLPQRRLDRVDPSVDVLSVAAGMNRPAQ